MTVLRKLHELLRRTERARVLALAGAMILMGVVEMVGVASILPFMQLVADPEAIERGGWLSVAYDRLGFGSVESALFAAGLFLFLVITFNNAFNALTIWFMQRFAWGLSHRLGTDLLARYLHQPYTFFLGRNTAGLNQTLLSEVNYVVTGVLLPVLYVSARTITALLIVALLAAFDWKLAATVVLVFGGAYAVVYAVFRRSQYRLGVERYNQNQLRFTVAQEALAGIKDVKTLGRESEFLRRFAEPSRRFSAAAARNNVVSRLPRYALEIVGFGGILLVVLYLLRTQSDVAPVLPILSLYAFAGYRLMPALNELFQSIVTIRFNTPALVALHRDLVEDTELPPSLPEAQGADATPTFDEALELRGVSFNYPDTAQPTLSDLNMRIEPKQVVGFVGATGAGKTTLVDLILGLLRPTEGAILVDDRRLDAESSSAWRRRCGYVPQEIFLSDDSISANVAFGIPESEVDAAAVEKAARMAQIHDFVAELPDAYDTIVGERGVRLSGGQRQRIGIARALYHDPEVLVLDEATNALDGVTETAVMQTVSSLMRQKTILVIAHRFTTVRSCDVIHLLEGGRIVASGTYDQLYDENPQFQAMAGDVETHGDA